MRFSAFAPILRIFDEAKAKDFYLGFLGFGLDWEHRFEPDMPLYAQISLGECVIHLSEHHGDASPGSAVRVAVDDIDGYHAEITGKGYKYMRRRYRCHAVGHARNQSHRSLLQSSDVLFTAEAGLTPICV